MYISKTLTRLAAAACLALGAVTIAAAPASAAPAANIHCTIEGVTQATHCYATLNAALASPELNLVTFVDWVNWNTAGGTLTVKGTHGCTSTTGDKDYRIPTLVPAGWNDRIASFSRNSNYHCNAWFSSDVNYEGECGNQWIVQTYDLTPYGCYDRASSVELS